MNKVLIVDDATFIRFTLRQMLERNGFEVVAEAENGEVGVQKYLEYKPDIVTMDITMPELDGVSALKKIKAIDPKAKVVMVSAMGQESFVKDAIINGANYFIVKPFEETKVTETLSKLISM